MKRFIYVTIGLLLFFVAGNALGQYTSYPQNSYQPNAHQPNAHQPNAHQPNAYQPSSYQPNSYQPNGEMMQLQAEVNQLRTRLDQLGTSQFAQTGCADCSTPMQPAGCCYSWGSGFTMGFDAVYLQPRFLESYNVQAVNPVTGASTLVPLDFDYSYAPRVYVGFKTARGMGIRAQYWKYDDSTADTFVSGPTVFSLQQLASVIPSAVAAVGGDQLSVLNSLKTESIDLEATYDMTIEDIEITGHLGVRYVEFEQSRLATVTGFFPQRLDYERRFHGVGLVGGAETRRPIGQSGLAVVIRGRGSALHGKKSVDRRVTGVYPSPPLPAPLPTPPVITLNDAKETTLLGEIAVGLEMRQRFQRFDLFGRVMYENRFWTGASTPALGITGFDGFSAGVGTTF